MLDYRQVRKFIVKPALVELGLWSQAAENLCLGTAMVESGLVYIDQIDKADKPGPAFGLCQMEGPTHADLWRTTLARDAGLKIKVMKSLTQIVSSASPVPDPTEMIWNARYAFMMCRVFYRRIPESLPSAEDAMALAKYHKRYYNTYLGKTKVEESVKQFEFVIKRSRELI